MFVYHGIYVPEGEGAKFREKECDRREKESIG